ncbi:DUF7255 family protein [Mongoliitalea daihaiensis]|uniref:DUF7255 family protein n=1 Tax=Mongoliitalea daihaiensis TaxID=2782006 RepID=UPI001F3AB6EF|nr:hypothetical protein [Mongoliitalea daihaiensis]UJP64196.1 hypothetical protein IPZ59_15470 [Mongoliitalea daihaiensis]
MSKHQLKVANLRSILEESDLEVDSFFHLEVNPDYLKGKGELLLQAVFENLEGRGKMPVLEKLRFDFKIQRYVFLYDDEVHFNRYRLNSLKTDLYDTFTFDWVDSYKRLCRTYEKECLKAGIQDRIWNGPPIARKIFGEASEAGDLSGNGASGWKLNAYNDAQYDLLSRLHGYKLIRLPQYENLMLGGSLKKVDDLLLQPKEAFKIAMTNWIKRKIQ